MYLAESPSLTNTLKSLNISGCYEISSDGLNFISKLSNLEYLNLKGCHYEIVDIGLSHLCCYGCSVIIDTLGFEFRGINKKYEIKWKSPLEKYFNVNTISSIVEKFQEFEKTLENIQDFSKINKYDAPFESKKLDKCTHRSNLISDDICHFLNYFSNHTDEFIFNIKIEQLIHLGTNLFSRRCFD
jgi:hypothetical protein